MTRFQLTKLSHDPQMVHYMQSIGKGERRKEEKNTLEAIKRNLGRIVRIRIVVKLKTKEKV